MAVENLKSLRSLNLCDQMRRTTIYSSIYLSASLQKFFSFSLGLLEFLRSNAREPVSLSLFTLLHLSLSSPLKPDQTASLSATRLFKILLLREPVKPDLLTLVSAECFSMNALGGPFSRTYVSRYLCHDRVELARMAAM